MSNVDEDLTLKVGLDGSEAKKDAVNLGKTIQQSLSKLNDKNASSSMLGLRNQINKVTADLEKAKAKKEELAKNPVYTTEFQKISKDLDKVYAEYGKVKEKIHEVQQAQQRMQTTSVVSPAYIETQKQIDATKAKLASLEAKAKEYIRTQMEMGKKVNPNASPLVKWDLQTAQLKQELADLQKRFLNLEITGKQFTTQDKVDVSGYKKLEDELAKLEQQYNRLNDREFEASSKMSRMLSNGSAYDTRQYEKADEDVDRLNGRLEQLSARYREVGEAGHKSGSKQGLGARIAQRAWNGFRGGFKNVIKSFKGFGKEAQGTFEDVTKNAKAMFWKILKYGLSIRSLYALIKKLRNTFKESIQVMGMDIPRIRDELNSLINGFQQVKYGIATAFQPIFSYVVPALNALISALNSAMVAVANFFATLTGQKVIYKATKQNKDYAKSISGAGKAAEDANEDIAEYDKLIVINQDKGGGGGGGGGDSGLDSGIFEEAPAKINELAQLIKQAWKKADFTDVGAYIGNKLNKGLQSINWTKIKATASKVGKSFATLINGFVRVPDLGTNIGKTIAEGINTAWTTVNNFVKNLDWSSVGTFIGDAIVGALTTLDFKTLGENLGLGLTGIARTISSVFSTLNQNLPQILENINRGIDSFLKSFDPSVIGKAFGEASTFILDFVNGILPKLPDIAEALGDTFNELVKNLPADKLATTISNFIKTAIKSATKLIKEVDFKELGKKIGEFLTNLDFKGIIKDLAELLWEAIKAAFEMLPTLIKEAPFETALIGAFALMKLTGLKTKVSSLVGGVIGNAFSGLWNVAKTWGSKLFGPLKSAIVDYVNWNGIGSLVGGVFKWGGAIAGAVVAAIGGWKLGNAFYNSLKKDLEGDNWIDNTVDIILNGDPRDIMKKETRGLDFKSLIYEQLQNPYYQARQEVEKLGLSGQEAYNYLATELDKIDVDSFIEANKTGVTEIDEDAKKLLETWKEEQLASAEAKYGVEEVKKSYAGIPTSAQEAMEKANASVSSGIDGLDKQAQNVTQTYNGMPSEIQSAMEKANGTLYQSLQDVRDKVREVKKAISENPEEVKNQIDTMTQKVSEMLGTTKTKAEDVKKSYNGMPSDIQAKVEQANKPLTTMLENLETKFKDVRGELEGTPEEVKGKIEEVESAISGVFEHLKGKSDEAKQSFEDIPSSVQGQVEATRQPLNDMFEGVSDKVKTVKDETDKMNKSMAKIRTTSNKTTKTLKSNFKSTFNLLQTKTDAYNQNMQATSDVISKSLDTTNTKISTIGSELDKTGQNVSKNWAVYGKDTSDAFVNAWSTIKKTYVAEDINKVGRGISTRWGEYGVNLRKAMTNAWEKITGAFNGTWGGYKSYTTLIDMGGEVEGKWSTVATNVQNAMTGAWGEISKAFSTPISLKISDDLSGVTGSLNNLPNMLVDNINNTLERLRQSINTIIDRVNYLSSKLKGMTMPHIERGQMTVAPLANGGVIPPNKEFLALLGDQKQGVNIETPLQTMVDAFNQALDSRRENSSNSAPIVLQLNGREVARAVWDENQKRYKQTGRYSSVYG